MSLFLTPSEFLRDFLVFTAYPNSRRKTHGSHYSMELVLVAVVPLFLLFVGAGILIVSQVSGFFQFNYFSNREKFSGQLISQIVGQIALAKTQLFSRTRELESLSGRLALTNQELARLNNLKSKFLSIAVHDMRTPVASIKGFSELAKKTVANDRQGQYLNYITSAAEQITRLLSDLTDLAMIEAGKLKIEKTFFDFVAMIQDVAPGISLVAKNKGVDFSVSEVPSSVSIKGDRFRLSQVLMNLLNNAIKFTPSGGQVDLRVRLDSRGVMVMVRDTGAGIHPTERKKIFEKFYQSVHQKDEKLRKQGWGLGLSIALEIIRAHRGDIGVDSFGLGKGSTFWFRIPLQYN
ncbi:MAG: HAMP domain-containing histidine kinase [Elusimicrobia bacterium]|nr:HAMP domain-containing histidine kinase [Elusimicrobiota bacterium]